MTREAFIKKWLGAVVVYNEETKAIMREDLQKVIDKFNEPETFNTEMQKLTDLENELMKKYIVQLERSCKTAGYIIIILLALDAIRIIHSLIN